MKKYIPYLIAALVGFHLRWIVSALNGWSYSMNGADIFVALMCVVMVCSREHSSRRNRRKGGQAMPYNRATIDKADSDPVNCGTCAYKNDCPAKHSYTECTQESGYPLWASSRLKSNWVKKKKNRS